MRGMPKPCFGACRSHPATTREHGHKSLLSKSFAFRNSGKAFCAFLQTLRALLQTCLSFSCGGACCYSQRLGWFLSFVFNPSKSPAISRACRANKPRVLSFSVVIQNSPRFVFASGARKHFFPGCLCFVSAVRKKNYFVIHRAVHSSAARSWSVNISFAIAFSTITRPNSKFAADRAGRVSYFTGQTGAAAEICR